MRLFLIRAVVGLLFLISLSSCSGRAAPLSVISKEGNYVSPSGKWVLNIVINSQKIVTYTVNNKLTKKVLIRSESGSTYHRWYFFWESESRLWVQSSDISTLLVWEISKTSGLFEEIKVERSNVNVLKVPPEVTSALSNSMRHELGFGKKKKQKR